MKCKKKKRTFKSYIKNIKPNGNLPAEFVLFFSSLTFMNLKKAAVFKILFFLLFFFLLIVLEVSNLFNLLGS